MQETQYQFDFNQPAQLERVLSGIGGFVVEFFGLLPIGAEFHASDLKEFVGQKTGGYVAPGSPDRIMRDLRKRRAINYVVVSRSKSLYQKVEVADE
jgi:hypothetical protein